MSHLLKLLSHFPLKSLLHVIFNNPLMPLLFALLSLQLLSVVLTDSRLFSSYLLFQVFLDHPLFWLDEHVSCQFQHYPQVRFGVLQLHRPVDIVFEMLKELVEVHLFPHFTAVWVCGDLVQLLVEVDDVIQIDGVKNKPVNMIISVEMHALRHILLQTVLRDVSLMVLKIVSDVGLIVTQQHVQLTLTLTLL